MASERQYGLTPPISSLLPNEAEKQSNEALFQELKSQGTFESPVESQKR
jgi:poly(A) polymerase